ncbi:GntR family transcriptional regulator [Pseudonocardia oroxyli]|uniref:Transcriptional regulator, GntR family n=1 Tax=Pseudonocardia oroxyli TaxID=366584 RepID=A0A1G7SPZ7_PSEOR|nr:GntR family transcriptional regulator [Pseudonocardia oroxyli]SDG25176.1 transcriptional regulator, GntR family [Pseudonocardia oroxyli]
MTLARDADPTPRIHRQVSLGQQVASALRRDIIRGVIPPGTVLAQSGLCEMYDVSRIPVRDALLTLANDGLVTRNRRNQMIVAEVTTQDLIDTFRAEAFLSGLAARRAAELGTEADHDHLQSVIDESLGLDPVSDKHALSDLSWRFHRRANQMARSPRLTATLRAVSIPLMRDFVGDVPHWWDPNQDEHIQILAALRARDADRAEVLTVAHFEHIGQALIGFLRGPSDRPEPRTVRGAAPPQ